MFDLSLIDVESELHNFHPDLVVITTAPTYLFWRCAPPELRVPQELTRAVRSLSPVLAAVGPHGSTTPRTALRKLDVDYVIMGRMRRVGTTSGQWRARLRWPVCFAEGSSIRVNGGPQAVNFKDQPALK